MVDTIPVSFVCFHFLCSIFVCFYNYATLLSMFLFCRLRINYFCANNKNSRLGTLLFSLLPWRSLLALSTRIVRLELHEKFPVCVAYFYPTHTFHNNKGSNVISRRLVEYVKTRKVYRRGV